MYFPWNEDNLTEVDETWKIHNVLKLYLIGTVRRSDLHSLRQTDFTRCRYELCSSGRMTWNELVFDTILTKRVIYFWL